MIPCGWEPVATVLSVVSAPPGERRYWEMVFDAELVAYSVRPSGVMALKYGTDPEPVDAVGCATRRSPSPIRKTNWAFAPAVEATRIGDVRTSAAAEFAVAVP